MVDSIPSEMFFQVLLHEPLITKLESHHVAGTLALMSMFVQTSRTIETEILAVLERNFVDTCCQCCQNVANIGAIFSFICIFLQNCFGSYIDIIL